MQTENQNIIFTVFNKKLVYILSIFLLISIIVVILFFTVIREEYVVLGLPFVLFAFILPIFIIGMRNKIIYRFTSDELQNRGQNPCVIKWKEIISFDIKNNTILFNLKNGEIVKLPLLNFNKDEINKALSIYIK